MRVAYNNKNLERWLVALTTIASIAVATSFVALMGFKQPLLERKVLYGIQIGAFLCFLVEKIFRFFNARNKKAYIQAIWFEIPLLVLLAIIFVGANNFSDRYDTTQVRIVSVWVYLILQVVDKVCRTIVSLAATGRNPMGTLIASFVLLILVGAGVLMLPQSYNCQQLSFIDALFTSTSATCVTGLIVKDTGTDFSLAGQSVILVLIQLGGLGIMVFGAVFALLLRQAISVSESVAMQDLLSSETLGRIGTMIGFIFVSTIIIETIGAFLMHPMWASVDSTLPQISEHPVFASMFHSISAFCNAGFALSNDSLIRYQSQWQVYGVFCVLIVLGGLGFGVLYGIFNIFCDRVNRIFQAKSKPAMKMKLGLPKKLTLQSRIVLCSSLVLIIAGAVLLILLEYFEDGSFDIKAGFFQSITARTAGFNTVDIGNMGAAGKMVLIILMFIGGSPGSTAGGIKTVTFVVIIMAVWSTIRKRNEVEVFKRSVKFSIVGRAITVAVVFIVVLFVCVMALSITERHNNIAMGDIVFESSSALGTVGLSTGITGSLTSAGKLIIILTMLIGRLGPLTLLASMTFNLRPGRFNYPCEALIVG